MGFSFGSVCSGIEAASVAWIPIGGKASWLSEIDKFPSEVLKHHYPDVENLGDMTTISQKVLSEKIKAPMVLVGGTPCQSFSVAGMRKGLSDERGALTISFVELANAIDNVRRRNGKKESVIVWENVPGVLSSKDNAFGCFLGALAGESSELVPPGWGRRWGNSGCVYGPSRAIAWRVLDAQYFGLAQRRKRVFVVASARKGFDPAKVLFEFDGVRRDIAPSREAGQETTGNAGACVKNAGSHGELVGTLCARDYTGVGNQYVSEGKLVVSESVGFRKLTFESYAQDETASTMMARDYKSHTDLVAYGIPGNWVGRKPENGGNSTQFMHEVSPTQTATDKHGVISINNCLNPEQPQCWRVYDPKGVSPTLQSGEARGNIIAETAYKANTVVRRLTPVECERLQGFPDGYTAIPWRGKPAEDSPDGHRYKALGNSMAVPVMRWLGERIKEELGV